MQVTIRASHTGKIKIWKVMKDGKVIYQFNRKADGENGWDKDRLILFLTEQGFEVI